MTHRRETFPGAERLARELSAVAEAESTSRRARREALRANLVARATAPPSPRRALPIALGLGALAAAALLALWVGRSERPLAASIDGEAIAEGTFVQAAAGERVARFSDGTRLTLAEGGAMRLDRFTAEGARVVLERGRVEASVVHREATRWTVEAGPYVVRVTGTRFAVWWSPVDEALEVALHEGAVEVTGPDIEGARRVSAGQRLELVVSRPAEAASLPLPASAGSDETLETAELGEPGATDEAPPEPRAARARPASREPRAAEARAEPDWRVLVESRRYREAVALVRERGLEPICASEPAQSLLRLADAARYARDASVGTTVLACVRARFPSSAASAEAAFFLGRIALEARDGRSAARWMEISLREREGGPFAEQAAGLLIEARELAGDSAGARSAADAYLDQYPHGIHVEVAERVARGAPD